mmetsp:Transcript_60959/g.175621  ORF Transcript_60959/g.175621 Transcript_60959/m.175621 type:complete len:443 (+) Transcript_60959:88-1416(+)|eukprot:CAMPEP_0176021116 /NCGR_PEP_ID=MMETSP0120_2-20121206/10246_1 /TAXON_ID=160619 /ORGANISM="Kryptoperidinium foliaceum, Strain CCMP 1326" /LENGTH=442 /DNA_ID=CAMNT_0017354225 /DNA_START=74 /DNA_END=1402 /DNA_ORIENTATION=-
MTKTRQPRTLTALYSLLVLSGNVGVEGFTTTSGLVRKNPYSGSIRRITEDSNRLSALKLTPTKGDSVATSNSTNTIFSSDSIPDQLQFLQTKEKGNLSPQSSSSEVLESGQGWFEPLAWRGVILILCALWASNFAVAKLVMSEPGVDSSLYALSRFGVAALALAPGAIGAAKKANMDAETLKASLICGSWVAFGYLGQTLGLLTTTASKSCVICSMHCVFVAGIAELWRVQRSAGDTKYDLKKLMPAILAVIGVAIVELKGAGGAPTVGDALSFAQPIGFGLGYLQLENIMSKKPEAALPVSALKLSVVAAASFLLFELTPLAHGAPSIAALPDFGPIIHSPVALGGILYTGLITTAFALWVESVAFAKVPATDASIILTTEPLIAAGLGAVTLGETFGASDYVGASLIIGACALAVLMGSPHETEDGKVIEEENQFPVTEI